MRNVFVAIEGDRPLPPSIRLLTTSSHVGRGLTLIERAGFCALRERKLNP
ncbi:hypothetical protein H6F93_24150 [Leptolyngbya sp. FACHB-671]|nr:hypothetical protein [Leptolyngbya sp. FACHB-671]